MKRKVLSVLLALTLVATLLPATTRVEADTVSGFWTDYADTDWEGSGTEQSPYLISSAAELAGLAKLVNQIPTPTATDNPTTEDWYEHDNHFSGAYFKLTDDIDLAAHYWVPIGNDFMGGLRRSYRAFEGNFDGDGYTVSNLTVDNTAQDASTYYKKAFGLFGALGGDGLLLDEELKSSGEGKHCYEDTTEVKNVTISGSMTLQGTANKGVMFGSLAGYSNGVMVSGVTCDVEITLTASTATDNDEVCCKSGGVLGNANDTSFDDCHNQGDLTITTSCDDAYYTLNFGGIAGNFRPITRDCSVTDCDNSGDIDVTFSTTGNRPSVVAGVVGKAAQCNDEDLAEVPVAPLNTTFENCRNTGDLKYDGSYHNAELYATCGRILGGTIGMINSTEDEDGVRYIRVLSCTNEGTLTYKAPMADTATGCVGGVIGRAIRAHIEDCINESTGTVTVQEGGRLDVGGMIGRIQNAECNVDESTLVNCENHADVTVGATECVFAAGLCGKLKGETMINCVNTGDVDAASIHRCVAAGLAGQVATAQNTDGTATILNSYTTGDVKASIISGTDNVTGCEPKLLVGGLAGMLCTYHSTLANYLMENSWSSGDLSIVTLPGFTGAEGLGGLFGGMSGDIEEDDPVGNGWTVEINPSSLPRDMALSVVRNCFWLSGCGATTDVAIPAQATVKCEKTEAFFTDEMMEALNGNIKQTNNDAKTYFTTYNLPLLTTGGREWEKIEGNDYPVLSDHEPASEPAPSGGGFDGSKMWTDETQEPAAANLFTDVPAGVYYADAVAWAVANGITEGKTQTSFAPNAGATRAQVVTYLWRAAGSPATDYAVNMTDVPADAYYAEALRWALANGVTKGTADTTFAPDRICTRAEIVTLLARYNGVADASATTNFADVRTNAYYAAAVDWAVANGVTQGKSATRFAPKGTCTRAQTVTFLYRLLAK